MALFPAMLNFIKISSSPTKKRKLMFFTRTHSYQSMLSKEALMHRLIGKHVKIHNLDFEVLEKDGSLRIIPHAEQIEDIKTLPITKLDLVEQGGKTSVKMTSKMRALDSGGPMIVMIFCVFLLITATVLYVCKELQISAILLGSDILLFMIFWIRMQTGYFDYIRKIRSYVKSKELEMSMG